MVVPVSPSLRKCQTAVSYGGLQGIVLTSTSLGRQTVSLKGYLRVRILSLKRVTLTFSVCRAGQTHVLVNPISPAEVCNGAHHYLDPSTCEAVSYTWHQNKEQVEMLCRSNASTKTPFLDAILPCTSLCREMSSIPSRTMRRLATELFSPDL
jgi:hypothetical protein